MTKEKVIATAMLKRDPRMLLVILEKATSAKLVQNIT